MSAEEQMLSNCGAGEDCWETAKRSNQSILKEINLEYSLEGLLLKLKLQYFDQPPDTKSQLTGKDPEAGKDWMQKEKGVEVDTMFR